MSLDFDAFEYFITIFQYDPEALEQLDLEDFTDEQDYEGDWDYDIPDNNF